MEFQKIKSRVHAYSWSTFLCFFCMTSASLAFPLKLKLDTTIEDVETTDLLKSIAQPVLEKNSSLKHTEFYIVFNPEFNAFAVEHGSFVHPALLDHPCIFMHTGILEREKLGTLVFVIFHELGHLAGKHVTKIQTAIADNEMNALAPGILGCLVAGATGMVLPAVYGLHMSMVKSLVAQLRYSRGHESSADFFACTQLERLKWPVEEGINMMLRNASKEIIHHNAHYLRSHPFFTDRAKAAQNHFNMDVFRNYRFPEKLSADFDKVKIKILAFSSDLHKALASVERADVSEKIKNYGRAIVAYRQGKTDQALQRLHAFEQENGGKTAYTCQLRSDILQTHGRHKDALQAIDQALSFSPKTFSFLLQKSIILMSLPQSASQVIRILEPTISKYGHHGMVWHWLGMAYARTGNTGRMHICLAEHHTIMQKWSRAQHHLRLGQKLLPAQDPYIQRAKDLARHILELQSQKK